jgi:VanZ family protein
MQKIAPDKWKHFYVGIVMGIVFQAFMWWLLKDHHILATVIAFAIVVFISYGFELFSKFTGKGHYELMDAIAAMIGGVIGMLVTLLIQSV